MLAGKDPYLVFEPDSEGGRIGISYWIAMENPEFVTLHRWSTANDETAYLDCHWQGPYDEVKEYDSSKKHEGISRLLALLADESGLTEEVPIRYQGVLSPEDVVAGVLAWLKKYGSEEKHVPTMRTITPATAMGVGSTVFANHLNNAARRAGVWRP